MQSHEPRSRGLGALILAAVLILVGGYYLLRNTFGIDLPELNGDAIWPILIILLGIGVLTRYWGDRPAA